MVKYITLSVCVIIIVGKLIINIFCIKNIYNIERGEDHFTMTQVALLAKIHSTLKTNIAYLDMIPLHSLKLKNLIENR